MLPLRHMTGVEAFGASVIVAGEFPMRLFIILTKYHQMVSTKRAHAHLING